MKKNISAILFVVISLIAPVAVAEDKIADVTDMQVLRAAVKSDKKAFVASTMKLTGAEAKKFWPITTPTSALSMSAISDARWLLRR